jgi:hypothetical protein
MLGTFDTNYYQNLVNNMAENNSFLDTGNLTLIKIQMVKNATSVQQIDQENATSKLDSLLEK